MLEMRTSERGTLKRCVQQWYWAQVEGLRPLRAANPLWFGQAVHEALAVWYQPGTVRGDHPAETFQKFLEGNRSILITNEEQEAEYIDARALGIDMLTRYVEHYGLDEHKDYIAPEYAGSIVLSRPPRELYGVKLPEIKKWMRYHFTWDGVFRNLETGELLLDEHKTAASIWWDFLPQDDQAGSYWAIASEVLRRKGKLPEGKDIDGIEYNFLRKAMGDTRPQDADGMRLNKATTKEHYIRVLDPIYELTGKETMAQLQQLAEDEKLEVHGDVSASQPPPYFERYPVYRSRGERATQIQRIKDEAFMIESYRNGDLPITKSPSTMNCRGCPYRLMCQLHEQGELLSVEEMKAAVYTTNDPYEVYRDKKSAE